MINSDLLSWKLNLDLRQLILNILEAEFLLRREQRGEIPRRKRLRNNPSLSCAVTFALDQRLDREGLCGRTFTYLPQYSKHLASIRRLAKLTLRRAKREKAIIQLVELLRAIKREYDDIGRPNPLGMKKRRNPCLSPQWGS